MKIVKRGARFGVWVPDRPGCRQEGFLHLMGSKAVVILPRASLHHPMERPLQDLSDHHRGGISRLPLAQSWGALIEKALVSVTYLSYS